MSVRGAEPEALFTGIFFCLVVCLTSKHTHVAVLLAVVLLRWSQFPPAAKCSQTRGPLARFITRGRAASSICRAR